MSRNGTAVSLWTSGLSSRLNSVFNGLAVSLQTSTQLLSKKRTGEGDGGREGGGPMGKQEGVKGPDGCLGGRGETNNLGITFWVESRGFWLTYLLSVVSSFPESPNLASGCVLPIMA